jgi:ubiquinone/menaquinone biosynthesis C-methylase UbiE
MLALTRAAYRTQHRAMALQAAVLGEAVRIAATRRFRRRADRALTAALARRFDALMARDLANVEAGLYPRQLLFQMPIARYARRLPALLGDLPRVAERARRRDFRDLPAEVDLDVYPAYYRRNFHWQTDGYLSRRSAELYDLGVELLFGGTADVMRRQVIPPVTRLLRDARGPARLLDIACGTGRTLHQIAIAQPDLAVVGIDLSRFYLASAGRLLRRRRAALVVGNGEALPFAAGSFDAVTCVYLLHELPLDARRRVLAEARRVLRPGGLLVLEDACQPADSPELAGALAQFQKDLHEPYFRSYLEHDLAGLVGEAGFAVESVEPHLVSVVVVARAG